jgi:hypothetical protein
MDATIRAHHLGFRIPTETALGFSLKITVSMIILSIATMIMVIDETNPDLLKGKKPSTTIKIKVRRARRKIENLFV